MSPFPDRRNAETMLQCILDVAQGDENILAVILNGSRANPGLPEDDFQDYDIIYLIKDGVVFNTEHMASFGEPLIFQLPDTMVLDGPPPRADDRTYLMLFKDGNRIDLNIIPFTEYQEKAHHDSLSVLLLDKTGSLGPLPESSDADYIIQIPTEKLFKDACNEFWWLSTYVVKGLCRDQILYAKEILEGPMRKMFLRMIEWGIGVRTDFTANPGQFGKHIKDHVSPELYEEILRTYPDAESDRIWSALFDLCTLFREQALSVSEALKYPYDSGEDERVSDYLTRLGLEYRSMRTGLHPQKES